MPPVIIARRRFYMGDHNALKLDVCINRLLLWKENPKVNLVTMTCIMRDIALTFSVQIQTVSRSLNITQEIVGMVFRSWAH